MFGAVLQSFENEFCGLRTEVKKEIKHTAQKKFILIFLIIHNLFSGCKVFRCNRKIKYYQVLFANATLFCSS